MKKYSEEELKTFKENIYGYLICPEGDYSQIKNFNRKCFL